MKVYKNVLPEDLISHHLEQIDALKGRPIWNHSQYMWPDVIRNAIVGVVNTTEVDDSRFNVLGKYFSGYNAKRIVYQYCIWNKMSGISSHVDAKYKFAASLYLNDKWDKDWGGLLVWKDKNNWLNAVCPDQNSMVVNDEEEEHLVTMISPVAPENRMSIQIWGFEH